ncbi:hypothetical protein [uncultured Tateyamaria sp.]|uniref:hypothetical protein n=1 Tax=uncultured Tateyamaria sp. TaxID=455651 RepID=UPI0026065554|nr:hypothetical protein [uncultured Tateyamaria sp.]
MIGFFVDDNAEDRIRISRLLEQDDLKIDPQFEPIAPTDLRDALLEKAPDLVALDFRLDDEDLDDNNYKGGALAQILREAVLETPGQDFPIILVSTEENIKQIYSIDRTSHDLFDQKYMKGRLNDKLYRATCHREVLSLANGYKAIASAIGKGQLDLNTLLDLDTDELEIVPLHGLATDVKDGNSVTHVVAGILLRQIIGRAGPLLAEKDIAAHLGLANDGKQIAQVMEYLDQLGMSYTGVFADGWPRVWRHRMDEWASELFGSPPSSLSGEERATKLSEATGFDLKPAVSTWTGKHDELFAFACSVCENPTERRNSLALYDKYLVPYLERRRVCFDCVIRGRLADLPNFTVDDSDVDIVDDIFSEKIKRA